MSDPVIRPARKSDILAIVTLTVQAGVRNSTDDPAEADDPGYLAAFDAIEADPFQELYVLDDSAEVIGTFQLSVIPGLSRRGMWRGQIENVFVREGRRGQGHGGKMMRWAIERLKERGCGLAQLSSNKSRTDAHRFYERLGFGKNSEGFKLYF